MSNLAVAAICSIPLWLTCAGVLLEDAIPAWRRRWQRNRAIRQARRTVVTPWPKSNVLRLDERRGG